MNYSLDKIKLQCRLGEKNILSKLKCPNIYDDLFSEKIERLPKRFKIANRSRVSYSPFTYRYGITLCLNDKKEGNLWLSCFWNGEMSYKPNAKLCLIEFNPNKSGYKVWEYLVFEYSLRVLEVKACDVAFDIPNVSIHQVYIDTKADLMTYGSISNYTIYIAPKARNGRVKIYQKDVERDRVGQKIEQTLRVEVSCKGSFLNYENVYNKDLLEVEKIANHLNSVMWLYIPCEVNNSLALLLVSTDFQTRRKSLNMMSSATKAKYKNMLYDYSNMFDFDCFDIFNILDELLNKYKKIGGKKIC